MAHSAQHHLFRSGSLAGSVQNTVVLVQAQTFLGDQELFPVMPGIWVAGLATASARWFICAVGNFKICQRQLCHSQKLSFEIAWFPMWNTVVNYRTAEYMSVGDPQNIHRFLGTDRLHFPYHTYHSGRSPQTSYARLNWNAHKISLCWSSLDDFLPHINGQEVG